MRILLVEDDKDLQRLLKKALSDAGSYSARSLE